VGAGGLAPNPQPPIPNPQSPIPIKLLFDKKKNLMNLKIKIK
jgi:hypothetical protein